jgi:putative transposase
LFLRRRYPCVLTVPIRTTNELTNAVGTVTEVNSLDEAQSSGPTEYPRRTVGSCRREILDHVIALNERHLLRLLRDYVSYHHQDRVHDSLEKDTPDKRPIEPKPAATANVTSLPRLGGLHHRYSWSEAA